LTDTAAAFLEKFIERNLIKNPSAEKLADLIMKWEGALDYFYYPAPERRKEQFLRAANLMIRSLLPSQTYNNLKTFYRKFHCGQ
jgi:hypothetical protein